MITVYPYSISYEPFNDGATARFVSVIKNNFGGYVRAGDYCYTVLSRETSPQSLSDSMSKVVHPDSAFLVSPLTCGRHSVFSEIQGDLKKTAEWFWSDSVTIANYTPEPTKEYMQAFHVNLRSMEYSNIKNEFEKLFGPTLFECLCDYFFFTPDRDLNRVYPLVAQALRHHRDKAFLLSMGVAGRMSQYFWDDIARVKGESDAFYRALYAQQQAKQQQKPTRHWPLFCRNKGSQNSQTI